MPMNKPLVSVIMAAYNHASFVNEAIRSIINQTYPEIELLIIDDGSTDATWQNIEALRFECEQRFIKTRFETQPNAGTCFTLNKLIAEAEGKYIYLIASDDVAVPTAIATEVEFLEQHPEYVLAVGDNQYIDTASSAIGWDKKCQNTALEKAQYQTFGAYLRHTRPKLDFSSEQFGSYESLISGNYIPNGYTITAKALKSFTFTKEAPLEDWYMNLQLAKLGKMKYIDEVLFYYRQHNSNTFRKAEHMAAMAKKTLLYEQKIVAQPAFEPWKKLFEQQLNTPQTRFRLGTLMHYYKLVTLEEKKKILNICGKEFIIKRKKRWKSA